MLLISRGQAKPSKKAKLNKSSTIPTRLNRKNNSQNLLTQLLKPPLMIHHHKTMKPP